MDAGYLRLEARSVRTTAPQPAVAVATSPGSVLLDLHTKTALIGRADPDVTLEFLRLEEEAVHGYIDLYVVGRDLSSETANTTEIGKDALYRFKNSWV